MTKCNIKNIKKTIKFSSLKTKKVQGKFTGGAITSDSGVLLLREIDKKLKLTTKVSKIFPDQRDERYCIHSLLSLLKQRIYGIACGYEDLNDHDQILDFDPTDDRIHGAQHGAFYNGYYREYCFLPLYVFCGDHLLVSYLRKSNIDGAKHVWAILSLLVKRLKQE